MPCNSQCDPRDCLFCLGMAIENSIFAIIRDEQEGEIDVLWYENQLDKWRHQEIDEFITELSAERCERIVYEFGIHKALKNYKDNFGEIPINDDIDVCKTLTYNIVDDALCVMYHNYKDYCKVYPLEEEEEEEEGEGAETTN